MVESIITVVLEVVKCLAPSTERHISYLRGYNNNFENLKKKIDELKGHRESVQHDVEEAKRQGRVLEQIVIKWFESVDKVIDEAEELVRSREAPTNNQCFKGLCPNLKARLQLSKNAIRRLEAISEHWEAGRFHSISYSPGLDDTQFLSSKDYEAFESRMSTLNDVLGALKDPTVYMLGIHGMGGIGKTTLAKEVAKQVKSEFDQVIFAEVSQSQDVRKIQGEIADKLGLGLHEESESGRAMRLCNRLMNEKRILVILDNIWEHLDLQAVGIPYGDDHKGCKVLMTARREDVLSEKMDSQRNFSVGFLKEEEAWSLFKNMAGDYIEGSEFKSVATEVTKECAGLPVSIVTVARALRKKRLFEWEDALRQLRSPSLTNFKDIQREAYSAIELSYNKLEGVELKKVFLLIAHAYLESVDDLLMYGMGLGLFEGINHMQEARNRVRTLVRKLKASCMLLDDIKKGEERFSIHDVVRDVAVSIASREQNVLSMINGELPNQWESSYTSIVLLDVKTNSLLPEELDTPQLKLFRMMAAAGRSSSSFTIPDNFFTKIIQVRVLELTRMHLLRLPSSLGLLTNLQTLCLHGWELQDIAVVGNFKKLEILCLRGCGIKQLPEEVGQLTQLKLLDLRYCSNLRVIPSNVLSKLSRLEELYFGHSSFLKWGVEVVKGQKNASLDELMHLPNLTSLELSIHDDVSIIPRGLFFEKLESFVIHIITKFPWHMNLGFESTLGSCREFQLDLRNTDIRLKDLLIVPLKAVEALYLRGLQDQDVKYLVHEFVNFKGSLQLKELHVGGRNAPNSEMQRESTIELRSNVIISDDDSLFFEKVAIQNLERLSLYSIDNERIWQSQRAAMSCGVQNLTYLDIYGCRNLKSLFSSSISSCDRLQSLKIEKCPSLEEVIIVDQMERKNFIFPRLQFLVMKGLGKLTSFCSGDVHIEFPTLKELTIRECPEFMLKYKSSDDGLTKKVWVPNLDCLRVEEKDLSWIFQSSEDFIRKLKYLDVLFEDESTIIPSLDFLKRFHTLNFLLIASKIDAHNINENGFMMVIRKARKFYDMKSILQPTILNDLDTLKILFLDFDNVMILVRSSITFHNLTTLVVYYCAGFIKLLTSSTAKSLVRLREMIIRSSNSITEIVTDDEGEDAAKEEIIFRELKKLELVQLKNLTSFYSGNCSLKFPSLETLVVGDCHDMKIFSGGELNTPKLHKVLLNRQDFWIREGDLNISIQRQRLKTKEAESSGVKNSEED